MARARSALRELPARRATRIQRSCGASGLPIGVAVAILIGCPPHAVVRPCSARRWPPLRSPTYGPAPSDPCPGGFSSCDSSSMIGHQTSGWRAGFPAAPSPRSSVTAIAAAWAPGRHSRRPTTAIARGLMRNTHSHAHPDGMAAASVSRRPMRCMKRFSQLRPVGKAGFRAEPAARPVRNRQRRAPVQDRLRVGLQRARNWRSDSLATPLSRCPRSANATPPPPSATLTVTFNACQLKLRLVAGQ